jgi:inner membrane transporter RhtA
VARAADPPATAARSAALSPEQLFVLGAVAQYAGASIAVNLFDDASAVTIGWFRVLGAVLVLAPFTANRWWGWSRHDYGVAALFGVATAGMNICFYVAIDHLPLGNSVAIEFIGPISVAAIRTRNRRNALALSLAVAGVGLLSGTELGHDTIGVIFILLAAALWAGYIVFGARVARQDRGLAGLSFGLLAGWIATAPFGVGDVDKVLQNRPVLFAALFVGLLSNAIPYAIDQHVLRRVSTRRFALLQALLPVVAAVTGAVVLEQRPTPIAIAGILLVVGGVALQDRT